MWDLNIQLTTEFLWWRFCWLPLCWHQTYTLVSSTRRIAFCLQNHAQSEAPLLNLAETPNFFNVVEPGCQHCMLAQSTQLQPKHLEIGAVHNHAETIKVLWWGAALRTPLEKETLSYTALVHILVHGTCRNSVDFLFKVCSAHLPIFTLFEHFLGDLMSFLK